MYLINRFRQIIYLIIYISGIFVAQLSLVQLAFVTVQSDPCSMQRCVSDRARVQSSPCPVDWEILPCLIDNVRNRDTPPSYITSIVLIGLLLEEEEQ